MFNSAVADSAHTDPLEMEEITPEAPDSDLPRTDTGSSNIKPIKAHGASRAITQNPMPEKEEEKEKEKKLQIVFTLDEYEQLKTWSRVDGCRDPIKFIKQAAMERVGEIEGSYTNYKERKKNYGRKSTAK